MDYAHQLYFSVKEPHIKRKSNNTSPKGYFVYHKSFILSYLIFFYTAAKIFRLVKVPHSTSCQSLGGYSGKLAEKHFQASNGKELFFKWKIVFFFLQESFDH